MAPKVIVEIGCGNGAFLDNLRRDLLMGYRCIGVDLSPKQIEDCKKRWIGSGMEFEVGDANGWIKQTAPHYAFVISIGTIQYLTERQLLEFFRMLRDTKCSIGLLEAVDEPQGKPFFSNPRGGMAYSHDYARLAREAGMTINFEKWELVRPGVNNVTLIAR